MQKTDIWHLKDIIQDIQARHPMVEEIYLFGSRAYGTSSRRSDIDLLAVCREPLPTRECNEWLNDKYPPVDLFKTLDLNFAESVINGSILKRRGEAALTQQLEAILLWKRSIGFDKSFDRWEQITDKNIPFTPTVGAPNIPKGYESVVRDYAKILGEHGYPNTLLGSTWPDIGFQIGAIVEHSLKVPGWFTERAKCFNKESIRLKSEYDFQNLIHIVLRPWIPTIEPEGTVIKFDGQDKRADFFDPKTGIVIEAKHICDASTKAAVLKTVQGLTSFYKTNPAARLLVFFVLVEPNVDMDDRKIEANFSEVTQQPAVVVKVVRNK